MSKATLRAEVHRGETLSALQSPEDGCARLVATLRDCAYRLKNVQLQMTELKRVGPRENFAHLRENRIAIGHEIERISSLISSCAASWSGLDSKNQILRLPRKWDGKPRSSGRVDMDQRSVRPNGSVPNFRS